MNTCLVCGSLLKQEGSPCARCGTEPAVLTRIAKAAGSRRFLFGHSPPPREMTTPPKETAAVPPRRRPATIRRKKAALEPGLFDQPPCSSQPPIRREPVVSVIPPGRETRSEGGVRALGLVIDIILCLLVNFVVLELVLAFSLRDVWNLIKFSLLPLMFVFLGFTIMYFWLFSGLVRKSLGSIIAQKIIRS